VKVDWRSWSELFFTHAAYEAAMRCNNRPPGCWSGKIRCGAEKVRETDVVASSLPQHHTLPLDAAAANVATYIMYLKRRVQYTGAVWRELPSLTRLLHGAVVATLTLCLSHVARIVNWKTIIRKKTHKKTQPLKIFLNNNILYFKHLPVTVSPVVHFRHIWNGVFRVCLADSNSRVNFYSIAIGSRVSILYGPILALVRQLDEQTTVKRF